MVKEKQIAIIGGGAAGFFGAINAAQNAKQNNIAVAVHIFESSSRYLKKVKISGGGRCNVTHYQFDIKRFSENYPRGQRELLSPFRQFQAKDTVEWFKGVGVELIAESDGRMFPTSNESQTIIDCYMEQVEKLKIKLHPNHKVTDVTVSNEGKFCLNFKEQTNFVADTILIATGSSAGGYKLAESLGHTITERAPSLFSFKIKDPLIKDLPGLSFETSLKLTLPGKKTFKQTGPTLITHWGLSGPAILKLSAWAAREMKHVNYNGTLLVNWLGNKTLSEIESMISNIKEEKAKTQIKNSYPNQLPKRFWQNLIDKINIDPEKQWANISKKEFNQINQSLFNSSFQILGQNRFKDEFVECGGVDLREIHFKTMESKIHPGLYFAGELLDVDGITGGFNFQNAWTTSWLAAQHMVNPKNTN